MATEEQIITLKLPTRYASSASTTSGTAHGIPYTMDDALLKQFSEQASSSASTQESNTLFRSRGRARVDKMHCIACAQITLI